MWLLAIRMCFLEKCLSYPLYILKLGYLPFYYQAVLYPWYKSFIRYIICKYFLLLHRLSCQFFDGVLWSTEVLVYGQTTLNAPNLVWSTKVFNFYEIQYIFSLVASTLSIIFKKSLSSPKSWKFTLEFYSEIFIILVLHLSLWSI